MMGEAHLVTRTPSPREEGAGGREERERGESEGGGGNGMEADKNKWETVGNKVGNGIGALCGRGESRGTEWWGGGRRGRGRG